MKMMKPDHKLLATLYNTITVYMPERAIELSGLDQFSYIFALDLWKDNEHARQYQDMMEWLKDHEVEYAIRNPSLSGRLICIVDPDLAFMFYLRFK